MPCEVLSADLVERVMSSADVTCPLGLRNRAMLETLYSTAKGANGALSRFFESWALKATSAAG